MLWVLPWIISSKRSVHPIACGKSITAVRAGRKPRAERAHSPTRTSHSFARTSLPRSPYSRPASRRPSWPVVSPTVV